MNLKLITALVVMFVVYFPRAYAEQLETIDAKATYIKIISESHQFPKSIERILSRRAMIALTGRDGKKGIGALDLMSRVFISDRYSDDGRKKLVLALTGLKLPDTIKYNSIYEIPTKGYIIHLKIKEQSIALFFRGFDVDSMNEIRNDLSNETQAAAQRNNAKIFLSDLLLSTAWADDTPALCGGAVQALSSGGTEDSGILKNTWECTKGALGGAWDGSLGGAWTILKGTGTAIIHPIDTFDKASEAFDKIVAMMSDMKGAFGDLGSQLAALPPSVKWHLGCELVSSIGTSVLIAYFTLGAGSPLLMKVIGQALARIAQLMPEATALKVVALSAKIALKAEQIAEIQDIIAKGPNGKEFIEKMKEFDNVVSKERKADLVHESYRLDPAEDDGGRYIPEHATSNLMTARREAGALYNANPELYRAAYNTVPELDKFWVNQSIRNGNYNVVTSPELRAKVIKELMANQRLNKVQKAAALAYISSGACSAFSSDAKPQSPTGSAGAIK